MFYLSTTEFIGILSAHELHLAKQSTTSADACHFRTRIGPTELLWETEAGWLGGAPSVCCSYLSCYCFAWIVVRLCFSFVSGQTIDSYFDFASVLFSLRWLLLCSRSLATVLPCAAPVSVMLYFCCASASTIAADCFCFASASLP